jgi:hypothetical protein
MFVLSMSSIFRTSERPGCAGTGGISTFDRPGTRAGRWWVLRAGYDYGNLLLVWNDHAHHWSWEPAQDMALATYQGLLAQAYLAFI